MIRRVAFSVLVAFLFLLAPLAHAQSRSTTSNVTIGDTRPRGTLSIRGNVRFAQNEKPVEQIKVELRRFTGDMVGTSFTRSNGEFEFTGLGTGTYYIVIEESGFEPVRDPVEMLTASMYGVVVYLKKIGTLPGETGDAVSVRELSLPASTRSAFRKAMELLYTKKDAAGSVPILQKVTTIAPTFYEAFFQLGMAYNELNRMPEAEAAFRKAVTVSEQKYPQALIMLGALLTTAEKAAEAEPLVRHAVALDASLWQAHYELGRALASLGRTGEAEKDLADAIKLRPDYAPAYLLLANVHIRTKNYVALLGDLNEYLRLDPDGPQSEQAKKMREAVQQAMDKTKTAPAPAPPKP